MVDVDQRFNELLAEHLERLDNYAIPVEAQKFLAWMEEHEPELLQAWLDLHSVDLIAKVITSRTQSARATARVRAPARAFQAAVIAAAGGNPTPLSKFRTETHAVNGVQIRVGKMTAEDHTFVAQRYRRNSNKQKMLEAFHHAVAKKLQPGQTTEDVFSEEDYDRLYSSIVQD